jgi:hypothetical protein
MTLIGLPSLALAEIAWDAEGGSHWWFDPMNWNTGGNVNNVIPPSSAGGALQTDAQINIGTGAWDQGEGVVYDPANDPFFPAAAYLPYPAGYGPQSIFRLYVSRNTTGSNLLTIKGDLQAASFVIVGRSGSTLLDANHGRINQLSGLVQVNSTSLDLGQREASGWGNGTYDYRGGALEVSLEAGPGLRLSAGSSGGAGGQGRFIMHNPASGGYVRAFDVNVAAHPGFPGAPSLLPDGVTTGVGVVEFHYANGGVRPIQVVRNLLINNGVDPNSLGVRSARLELQLDAPVPVDANGVPQDLGLFDVDFSIPDDFFVGGVHGAGSLGGRFSSGDGATLYDEGAVVSAAFGNVLYNWTISYTGAIAWSDPQNSVVASISGPLTGTDVVLMGLSSVAIPEPASGALVTMAALGIARRRRRDAS